MSRKIKEEFEKDAERHAPDRIEFWQGRPSRMHDRVLYRLDADGGWEKSRLYP